MALRSKLFVSFICFFICVVAVGKTSHGHLTIVRRAMMSKEKTVVKNASWLSLENAKLKTRLLKNQVHANQLNFCVYMFFVYYY